jgi:methylmalonyl-CoA mutase N-terminal domain/subunit
MTDRRQDWERERLDPTLKRAPERKASFSTMSDMPIERLYGPWSMAPDEEERIGLPGEPPFTRGIHPTGYRSRLWTMRMFAGFGSAEDTNQRFHQLLAAGQTGLSIAYDMPTLYGYDTDDPEAEGEFGTCGVGVSSLADMEVLLDGLPLDKVSTSMTINSPAAPIWAMYIVAAEKDGRLARPVGGHAPERHPQGVHRPEGIPVPAEPSMRLVTDTIEFGTREMPRWNTISISGYHIREAGSTGGPGAGLHDRRRDGLRRTRARARPAGRRLRATPVVLLQLAFRFLRGDRQVPRKPADLARPDDQAICAENERSAWMRFHTQTAGVSLSPQQPLNNLTRVALQALAGVLAGRSRCIPMPTTKALAVPTAEAALLALRQQQVIAEESGVDATVDPLGGSWFVEALTDETERQVWRYIDEIDRRGGMVAAIAEGYPQREIADAAYRYQRELDAGERRIVGVNAYVDESEETRVPVLEVPAGSVERQLERLERTRRERDAAAVEAALAGLRDAASRPGSSETNLMPHFIRAAEAYATLGEMCGVLRGVFGEYREPVAV